MTFPKDYPYKPPGQYQSLFSAASTDNSQTSDSPNHYGIQTFIPTADSVSRFFMLREKTLCLERVLANDGHQLNALNLS
jgi:hypothetical protein